MNLNEKSICPGPEYVYKIIAAPPGHMRYCNDVKRSVTVGKFKNAAVILLLLDRLLFIRICGGWGWC